MKEVFQPSDMRENLAPNSIVKRTFCFLDKMSVVFNCGFARSFVWNTKRVALNTVAKQIGEGKKS